MIFREERQTAAYVTEQEFVALLLETLQGIVRAKRALAACSVWKGAENSWGFIRNSVERISKAYPKINELIKEQLGKIAGRLDIPTVLSSNSDFAELMGGHSVKLLESGGQPVRWLRQAAGSIEKVANLCSQLNESIGPAINGHWQEVALSIVSIGLGIKQKTDPILGEIELRERFVVDGIRERFSRKAWANLQRQVFIDQQLDLCEKILMLGRFEEKDKPFASTVRACLEIFNGFRVRVASTYDSLLRNSIFVGYIDIDPNKPSLWRTVSVPSKNLRDALLTALRRIHRAARRVDLSAADFSFDSFVSPSELIWECSKNEESEIGEILRVKSEGLEFSETERAFLNGPLWNTLIAEEGHARD